ncbi:hypothetical protein HK097_011308 [Rhizophlyctis rosea]|uniref:Uncharacterized protein n=1 Tax=Rhizophlyctis rosea TaxID=64517 RepID=A0AAD5S7Z0_9FUNG|nr:hypothetical protein HK097_011308 [Rhizophlyctis rosea]
MNRGRTATPKFFNSTLPQATRDSERLLNIHIVPFARKAHDVTKAIANKATINKSVPDHIKNKAKKVSDF